MRIFVIISAVLVSYQLNAQSVTSRDTVRPDTTMLVPIHVTPMDTPAHHKMPVVDPTKPDTLSPEMKEMRKKEDQ